METSTEDVKPIEPAALFGSSEVELHAVIHGWTYMGWIKRNPEEPEASWAARMRHKESVHGETRVYCDRTAGDGWNCWAKKIDPREDCCEKHSPKHNPFCTSCNEAGFKAHNLPNTSVETRQK